MAFLIRWFCGCFYPLLKGCFSPLPTMIPDGRAFICLSPDKAEYPFNAIGITKAIGEKTFRDILFVSDLYFGVRIRIAYQPERERCQGTVRWMPCIRAALDKSDSERPYLSSGSCQLPLLPPAREVVLLLFSVMICSLKRYNDGKTNK